MAKHKNNRKNTAPVADEHTQEPAPADVPTIEVVDAKQLDPVAYEAAQATANRAPVTETPEAQTDTEAPASETITPAAETPAANGETKQENGETKQETPEPAKERVFHLRLNSNQLCVIDTLLTRAHEVHTVELADAKNIADEAAREQIVHDTSEDLARVKELQALCERARKTPAGNGVGTGYKIFDQYSPIAILNWMGANGFNQYDAKNALAHFGVDTDEIAKTTWSRALAKGKKPGDNKIKIVTLTPEQELELMQFYNLAAREAAAEAQQKIDSYKARIKQLPAVTQ